MSSLRWWGAVEGIPWSWEWRPLLGVWLFVAALAVGYGALVHRVRKEGDPGPTRSQRVWFGLGLFLVWAGLDWPLGALGSRVASLHMVQYVVLGVLAPPLLVLGLPSGAFRLLAGRHRIVGALRSVTHPIVALVIFNAGMTVTHWPGVVDGLMPYQLGSFLIDMTWIACGLILWWPVVAPVPARPAFHPLLQVAYLAANVVFVMPPAAMLLFSESPVYAIYQGSLAGGASGSVLDQQRAGALMKVGSAWILAMAMLLICFRWYWSVREEAGDAGLEVPTEEWDR